MKMMKKTKKKPKMFHVDFLLLDIVVEEINVIIYTS